MVKKKSPRKQPQVKAKPGLLTRPWRWLLRHWWQLSLVLLAIIGGYSVYLDAIIQDRFDGNKWQVPVQIYARPLRLTVGAEITPKELLDELKLLAYRPVKRLQDSGEYLRQGNTVSFSRREFTFADGHEPQRDIQITYNGDRIGRIVDLSNGETLSTIRLEPWLVTRLLNAQREDRMLVTLDKVPPMLIRTLLLVEDRDFYQHHGVEPTSILRALMANIKAGRNVQGGSTLTQQLVKNLFLTRKKSLLRKAQEAWMALLIELRYSKQVILQAYLNEVFLGQNGGTGVYGFGLASYFYFNRPLDELNVAEMATLVGMVKGPSYYNPRRHPRRVLARRDMILRLLLENDQLTKRLYQQQVKKPLHLASDSRLAQGKHPAYMDEVKRELREAIPNPQLFASGIKVFTTMDSLAQRRAELAMHRSIPELEKAKHVDNLQGAMLVSDIHSGEIRAIVGGSDTHYNGFNRALDARRAIGSVIKPAIYLSALEQSQQYNLATLLPDEPITLRSSEGKVWQPLNDDKQFRGQVNLITALSHSLNVPTVNLAMQVGLGTVVNTLHRLGIDEPISQYPAMALGAVSFSPLQVNQMYQTIANEGRKIPLHTLLAVLDTHNKVLWSQHVQADQVVDANATYLINYALHRVTSVGTAHVLKKRFPRINMAGKTGTTDDYRDSWFSGFDRNGVITVWVGKDDNQTTRLTGSGGALDVFIHYQQLQQPKSLVRSMPPGVGMAHFNPATGQRQIGGCASSIDLPAILADLPPPVTDCTKSEPKPAKKKSFWQRLFGN